MSGFHGVAYYFLDVRVTTSSVIHGCCDAMHGVGRGEGAGSWIEVLWIPTYIVCMDRDFFY